MMTMLARMGLLAWLIPAAAHGAAAGDDALFLEQVVPILERRCVHCHGETTHKANLSLNTAAALLRGGDSGPAIVPGTPQESLLLDKITGDPPEMPQKDNPLAKEDVAAIRTWIERGAVWPAGLALKDRRFKDQRWWAFEPLVRPDVPSLPRSTWARTPIDAFVLTTLEKNGLKPSPEADRRTLIRRLSFDLIGLPPTPDEIEAFVRDPDPAPMMRSSNACSPTLITANDGAGTGSTSCIMATRTDTTKTSAGTMPGRIATMSSPPSTPISRSAGSSASKSRATSCTRTRAGARSRLAFIAAGPWDFVGHVELREGTVDKLKTRLLDRDDMVASTMSTFVSLTVHCARCHDHKFDPIAQTDYYHLQAVFAGVDRGDRPYENVVQTGRRRSLEARREAALALARPGTADRGAQEPCGRRSRRRDQGPAPAAPGNTRAIQTHESPTNGYHSAIYPGPDALAWVQLDLGEVVPIDEIRLIPARPTDFADTPGFGFPVRASRRCFRRCHLRRR